MLPFRIIPRILFFQVTYEDIQGFTKHHFLLGLIGTWLAGIGRYWDHPNAELLQYLGLGSVIYIFLLAALLFLVGWPYKLPGWSYFRVLTFVSLTSFPAILYAIPVERFLPMPAAASLNAWFLAIVAAWRLALLVRFNKIAGVLNWGYAVVLALFPMCLLIVGLTILNLEKAVFNIMGGMRETTGREAAYDVLLALSVLSFMAFLPLVLIYAFGLYNHRRRK